MNQPETIQPQSNQPQTKSIEHKEHDPLLVCLALIATLIDRPVHISALRTGFAVDDNGRIPIDAFPDVARQHGMIAAWTRNRPTALPNYVLPVIAPFIDGRACVIRLLTSDSAKILLPDSGMTEVTMDTKELEALSTGEIMVVKASELKGAQQIVPFKGEAFNWFWGTLWRFRKFYVESMLATVVANILTLASVFFTMNVYDRVVPTQAYNSLWTLAIGTVVAVFLEFVMRWLKARLVDLGGKKADVAINATLLREIMSIRLEHRPQSIGIFSSSMRDFEALRDFFSSASLVLVADLPFVLLFLFLIGVIGGPIALIPGLAVLLISIVGILAQKPMTTAMRSSMKQSGDRQSVLVESMLNLEQLKAHNAESYLQRRWESANMAGSDSYKKTRALTNLMMGMTASAQQLVTVGMVVLGVYLIHENQLTLGSLIACVILSGRAIAPIGSIMSLASRFQQAMSSLATLDGLMKRPRDRDATRRYIVPETIKGDLQADDVEFAYPAEHKIPVLRRVSLKIDAGQRTALLGKVGSGKSTLVRLMAGLYTPLGGSIKVDGIDTQQIEPAELRTRISYIGQDAQLFMGSLRDNLVLSDSWITDAKLTEVLKKLDLYNIVANHPLGLDMPLTEAGGGLSGGQKQLLGIARMMVRDPIFVFMDEPTSHMDQNTETRVIQVLGEWLKGRTVLVATHRPQLLVWATHIAVLEREQILTQGPRDEVLQRLSKGIAATPATSGTPAPASAPGSVPGQTSAATTTGNAPQVEQK